MQPNLLFLTLKVFCITGGIEKVSRVAGKAFADLGREGAYPVSVYSAYDEDKDLDPKYFSPSAFKGFGGNRARFALRSIQRGRQASVVVLSHINLLSVGYAIKKLSPRTRLVLFAHGIEVWQPLPEWKKRLLQACDLILPVSQYTKDQMVLLHGLNESRFRIVNNCLDPFLPPPAGEGKNKALLQRYGLQANHKVLLTLTRLSFKERYKGYDEVLMALKTLKKKDPLLRYLIVGKADADEKARLERLITQQGLEEEVILAGFVADEELKAHFDLADVYVMPSRKEGFGIVFIEAMYYGLPVIAGNLDGSVDALANGELGILIHPDRPAEVVNAISQMLNQNDRYRPNPAAVSQRFGFAGYKEKLRLALRSLHPPSMLPEEIDYAGQLVKNQ